MSFFDHGIVCCNYGKSTKRMANKSFAGPLGVLITRLAVLFNTDGPTYRPPESPGTDTDGHGLARTGRDRHGRAGTDTDGQGRAGTRLDGHGHERGAANRAH